MINRLPAYWFKDTGKTQRRSVAVTNGSVATTYADYLTNVPMRLVPHGGGENGNQERLNTQNPDAIYTNGSLDITATDRIVFNSRVYDIVSVNNFDEAGTYMKMDCTEVQPSGVGS